MNVILCFILFFLCCLFLLTQSGYCQNTDTADSDSTLVGDSSDSLKFAGDSVESIKVDVSILKDSLVDQIITTIKSNESLVGSQIKDQVSSMVQGQSVALVSITDQLDGLKAKAELWKKCGVISEGLLPALPVTSNDFKLSSNGSASLQSQYNNSGSELPRSFAPQGWYSVLSATNSFSIASIPITLSGNVVFQNNSINFNYSTGNFSFDHRKLLAAFKERLISTKMLDELKHVDLLPEDILDSLSKFEEARSWINDETNLNSYIESFHITDSLESKVKSSVISYQDSLLLDSMRQVKQGYEQAKQFYQKVFKLYQKYQDRLEQLQQQLKEVSDVKQQLESITDPNQIVKLLNQDSLLSKKEQMLSSVRQFSIGAGAVTISPLTLQDFLFKGAQTEIYTKGMYLSAGGGVMQSFPFMVPGALLPENFLSRRVAYATVGEGLIDSSYTHGSLVYLHDQPTASGSMLGYLISKTDWIGSVRKRILIGDKYSVYTELAYSSLSFDSPNAEQSSSPITNKVDILSKSAAEVAFRKDNENEHATLLVRYTGPGYVSLGNPMLLSNMIHTELEYGTSLFEKKLEATIAGYYDQRVNSDLTGSKAQHWGVRTKALYHLPGGAGFVSASWTPDQLQTISYQYNEASSIYQHLSINGFFNYKLLGIRQSSFVDVSAFFGTSRFGETSSTSKLITGSFMQQIFLGKHHLSLQCFATNNHASSFVSQQLVGQLTDCIQIKKNSLMVGLNWTSASFSPTQAGLILGGNIASGKAGTLSVSANLKVAVKESISFNHSQQMLSFMWQINW